MTTGSYLGRPAVAVVSVVANKSGIVSTKKEKLKRV